MAGLGNTLDPTARASPGFQAQRSKVCNANFYFTRILKYLTRILARGACSDLIFIISY